MYYDLGTWVFGHLYLLRNFTQTPNQTFDRATSFSSSDNCKCKFAREVLHVNNFCQNMLVDCFCGSF